MESSNLVSRDASGKDAMLSNVTDRTDSYSNENTTDSMSADAVPSCSTADATASAAESHAVPLDPYGYVQRGDYTSEVYKLELMNLPKRFGIAVSEFSYFYRKLSIADCTLLHVTAYVN